MEQFTEKTKPTDLKSQLRKPVGIIFAALGINAVAFIESVRSFFWSPFIIIHTLLLFAVPIYLKSYKFGSLRKCWSNWRVILFGFIGIKAWQTLFQVVYDYFLGKYGLEGNWQFDLFRANNQILNQTADKYHSILAAMLLFGFTILVIPFAEELFYRGYVFGALKESKNFWYAAIVSSLLLALRHFAHPLFLVPFPAVSATIWVISVIPIGLLLAYIYDRTDSLWPVIVIHFLLNAPIIPRI